jgi:methyl-accepting chemotaxis protein
VIANITDAVKRENESLQMVEKLNQTMEEMKATQEQIRRHEQELDEKVHWYESLLDACTDTFISVTDMDGKVMFLNRASLEMLGITKEEAIGKPCSEVWKIENCHTKNCGFEQLKKGNHTTNFKVGDQHFSSSASYIENTSGAKTGHIEVISNITDVVNRENESLKMVEKLNRNMEEMKATQEQIRRHEQELDEKVHWYESLLDACADTLISVTDMDGKVTFLNKAALDMLGMTKEETLGKPCSDVWKVENCHTENCGFTQLKKGNHTTNFKVGDQYFSSSASYIKNPQGENIGHIEVISNVSELTKKG